MEMVFKFRQDSGVSGNAQVVGEALHSIRERKGRLTPADVVEEAAPAQSPLHRYFEWDNTKAAEKWRIEQSRYLISSVVVVEADAAEIVPVRAFANVRVNGANSYEPLSVVMADPELRLQVVREVKREIERLKGKLKSLDGFGDLLAALGEVENIAGRKLNEAGAVSASHA